MLAAAALLVLTFAAAAAAVCARSVRSDDTANGALTERIDALLPQTQCRQCGHAGCRPYAAAIAAGHAQINQCAPGGDAGVARIARLLGRAPLRLNPANGVHKPPALALIDEENCIGCTLCIQACPVDAIVGAAKQMHTVLKSLCTGCELCIAPCPVDCISMVPPAARVVIPLKRAFAQVREAA
jgi:Na+-translocating ferredoxin:NAD+ oxidoreductase subunit B